MIKKDGVRNLLSPSIRFVIKYFLNVFLTLPVEYIFSPLTFLFIILNSSITDS